MADLVPVPYPLCWPSHVPRTVTRKRSRFKSTTVLLARSRLMRELERFKAEAIVISSDLRVRDDGLPYARAHAPLDPGVVVYFSRRHRLQAIPADAYVDVIDNIIALAEAVKHFRGLERHGSVQIANQAMSAFLALAPASGFSAGRPWREVLGLESYGTPDQPDLRADLLALVESRYKRLMIPLHPDPPGTPEEKAIRAEKLEELKGALVRAREELR